MALHAERQVIGEKGGPDWTESFDWNSGEKKESLWPLEEETGHAGGLQRCREVMQWENLKDQSQTGSGT